MIKKNIHCFLLVLLFYSGYSHAQTKEHHAILVYTKNGKGYVHDNIPYAVSAIKALCARENIAVDITDDPNIFTEGHLQKYSALVFPSTNNDVFDGPGQRLAFRRYIEAGGGLVGLHSVTGTERNWKWFKMLIGCTFDWHAPFQRFDVRVINEAHPSVQGVPLIWTREDELYFGKELYPVTQVMMAHHITSLDSSHAEQAVRHAAGYAEYYPAVWYNAFQGGHAWISTLGHSKESYSDPVYLNHLWQGLRFILGQVKKVDFSKASAVSWDDPIR